jgi:hypothetical protein
MSALPPKADIDQRSVNVRLVPLATERSAAKAPLFDHLVGAREQRRRHVEAECLGGIEIDHQLEFVLRAAALPGPKMTPS